MLFTPSTSLAEHTVYYRYTVLGYVKDGAGMARPRTMVELVRDKTGLSYRTETDTSGLYVLVARLGDESLGETLRLQVDTRRVTIVARFDPGDHVRERGTRVDFVGETMVETPATFLATLQGFLAR
jgi:hypothetical protein